MGRRGNTRAGGREPTLSRKRKRVMPRTRFDAKRTDDMDEYSSSGDGGESEADEHPVASGDNSSDEDEDNGPTVSDRPYAALLDSLKSDSAFRVPKRRKAASPDYARKNDQRQGMEVDGKKTRADADISERGSQAQDPQASSGELEHNVGDLVNDQVDVALNHPVDGHSEGAGPIGESPISDDGVGEPEDISDDDLAELPFHDDDDDLDDSDPWLGHFAEPNEDAVAKKIQAIREDKWSTSRLVTRSSKNVITAPSIDGHAPTLPTPIPGPPFLKLKQRLQEPMLAQKPTFDEEEQAFASLLFNYHDILYCKRSHTNGPKLRRLLALHALNHCFKTRDRILKNTDKLNHNPNFDHDFKDQGFTRPKVLFLLPTRESAAKLVNAIASLLPTMAQEQRKRFDDAFVDKEKKFSTDKPADFRDLFEGNDDDMFRIGLKFTRKTIKFYTEFYNSDILIASPLGLRTVMEGDTTFKGKRKNKKGPDFEYLSSIELVVLDQADALLMQNWEHVEYILEHVNRMPQDTADWDFQRMRTWYLDDQAKYYRQNVVLSQFNTPELAELQRVHFLNWNGKVRVQPEYKGEIGALGMKVRQTFTRFDAPTVAGEPEARFKYFTATIVPMLAKKTKQTTGTLLFIPSYIDFVRIRNYFATSTATANLSFGTISEYADVREASRAMSHFQTGRHKVLLYTERAHHFRRNIIRAAKKVVFYALPENPVFYREIVAFLGKSEQDGTLEIGKGEVRVCFSKYDVLRLERVVGSQRVGKMILERGDTFDFM